MSSQSYFCSGVLTFVTMEESRILVLVIKTLFDGAVLSLMDGACGNGILLRSQHFLDGCATRWLCRYFRRASDAPGIFFTKDVVSSG